MQVGRLLQMGRRGWLLAAVPLILALVLLAAGDAQQTDDSMTELEARLAGTLTRIEGAGKVCVMVLEDDAVQAFAQEDAQARVKGVLIVAQGAGDLSVRMRLQQAAMTLFALDAVQVEVLPGGAAD